MEFLISVGTELVAKVAEYTLITACRLVHFTNHVVNLQEKLVELSDATGELQAQVDQAARDGDIITEEGKVLNWISEATRISQEAERFLETDCRRANLECFGGSLPNLLLRRQLSKKVREMTDELSRAAGNRFCTVIIRSALQSCIADEGSYEDFGTRELILKEVMAALNSSEVTMVGLYGMGGVGKTMLAQEIARRAKKEKLFNEAVFVPISQTQDVKAIQHHVADKIHLSFGEIQSEAERADQLKRQLKKEKKILVILDDVWSTLDLGKVGLNFDPDQNGCKILMTTRFRDVTSNCYCVGHKKSICIEALDFGESRKLFRRIVGPDVFDHPDFNKVASDLVNECKGLPLAITTVASALKGKKLDIWEDALHQLQNSAPENIDGMLKSVYSIIWTSFDQLESEEAKKLLLLCSLYADDMDIDIEELTMLGFGWDLFQGVHSVAATRKRVHSLVRKLKDCCLLLDGSNDNLVKMHDVMRDVVKFFASKNQLNMHSFVINDALEDFLSKDNVQEARAISLHRYPNTNELPERELEFSKLELFFLISSCTVYDIDSPCIQIKDFLKGCTSLKALSLFRVNFLSLPSPIHLLQNLVTLRLHHCELGDIDYIGDLRSLTVLDLTGSNFKQLPSTIGQLTRLKVLKLKDCEYLTTIRENVISKLTRLEELHIPRSYGNWKVEVVRNLMTLQKLTTLSLRIPNANVLPKLVVFSPKLERYSIEIGLQDCARPEEYSRLLAVRECEASGFESLMRNLEYLSLKRSRGAGMTNNVVNGLDKHGFPLLKTLELDDCDGIQYIIRAEEQNSIVHPCSTVLLVLEELCLSNLRSLEAICHRKLAEESFGQLRAVKVWNCGRLKNIFPLSIATRLHQIEVFECEEIEVIVVFDDVTDNPTKDAPLEIELRNLYLDSLPMFIQFIRPSFPDDTSSVESSRLFDEQVALTKLQRLTLRKIDVKSIWAHEIPSASNNCIQKSMV